MSASGDKNVSPSKFFVGATGGFCLGIGIGTFVEISQNITLSLILVGTVLIFVFKYLKPKLFPLIFSLVCLVVGIWRVQSVITFQKSIPLIPPTTIVTGIVTEDPQLSDKNTTIVLDNLKGSATNEPFAGKARVTLPWWQQVSVGDQVTLACSWKQTNPTKPFDQYLWKEGIVANCTNPKKTVETGLKPVSTDRSGPWSITSLVLVIPHAIQRRVNDLFPQPFSSFLFGLFFGGSGGIPEDMKDVFTTTGLSHVLAASGFNVALFSQALFLFCASQPFIGRKRAVLLMLVFLPIYALTAGFTASVLRAALMASLGLVGIYLGRKAWLPALFLLPATILLAIHPLWLIYDIGFQLSFAATASLLIFLPVWEQYIKPIPETLGIKEALASSIAATIGTFPILMGHLHSVSIISPIFNIWILPFLPALMLITSAIFLVSLISLPLAKFGAALVTGFLHLLFSILNRFGDIPPWTPPESHIVPLTIISSLIVITLFVWHLRHSTVS